MSLKYDNIRPLIFKFSPKAAHKAVQMIMILADKILPSSFSFIAKSCVINDARLQQNLFGSIYNNPIGIAGGFDKNATITAGLSALGFGYLEYGTFTQKSQNKTKKSQILRLVDEKSIQSDMDFSNDGSSKIKNRLSRLYPNVLPLWANIDKNEDTLDKNMINDYEFLVREFNELCDAFVLNLNSFNDNNLVTEIFTRLKGISKKPIILKIPADLEDKKAIEISKNAVDNGADGIIISNSSLDYTLLKFNNLNNFGSLSGKVIKQKSRELLKAVAKELFTKTVLIASGGIDDAKEAYERIKIGASLVQIFTSFIFKGPMICRDINKEILYLLQKDGFSNISEAVGVNIKNKEKY